MQAFFVVSERLLVPGSRETGARGSSGRLCREWVAGRRDPRQRRFCGIQPLYIRIFSLSKPKVLGFISGYNAHYRPFLAGKIGPQKQKNTADLLIYSR